VLGSISTYVSVNDSGSDTVFASLSGNIADSASNSVSSSVADGSSGNIAPHTYESAPSVVCGGECPANGMNSASAADSNNDEGLHIISRPLPASAVFTFKLVKIFVYPVKSCAAVEVRKQLFFFVVKGKRQRHNTYIAPQATTAATVALYITG